MVDVKKDAGLSSRSGLVKRLKFVAGIQVAPDDRDDILEAIKILEAPLSEQRTINPIEVSVDRFLKWVESCDGGLVGDSRVAIDAQKRILRQFIEFLQGDEWLKSHVEYANRNPSAERNER